MRNLIILLSITLFVACGTTQKAVSNSTKQKTPLKDQQTFLLTEISKDKSYGYNAKNPIEVGGASYHHLGRK